MKNKVFFSYVHLDNEIKPVKTKIEKIINQLKANYAYTDDDYFYDDYSLKGGDEIFKSIQDNVPMCDYFFRFVSKNYYKSIYCLAESGLASLYKKIIIINVIVEEDSYEADTDKIYFEFDDLTFTEKMIKTITSDKNKLPGIANSQLITNIRLIKDEDNFEWKINFTMNKKIESISILLGFKNCPVYLEPKFSWFTFLNDNINNDFFLNENNKEADSGEDNCPNERFYFSPLPRGWSYPKFEENDAQIIEYHCHQIKAWIGRKFWISSNTIKEPDFICIFKGEDPRDVKNWEKYELNWES